MRICVFNHPDSFNHTPIDKQQDSLRHCHGQNGYNKLYRGPSIQATVANVENLYRGIIKSRGFKHLL